MSENNKSDFGCMWKHPFDQSDIRLPKTKNVMLQKSFKFAGFSQISQEPQKVSKRSLAKRFQGI